MDYRQSKQNLTKQIWKQAQVHSEASKVGVATNLDHFQMCPCCDQPIEKQPISMTQHTKQFQVFGFGYSLWFSFLKYCIFLVLVLIASKTSSQLYLATKQNYGFCYGHKPVSEHQTPSNSIKPIRQQYSQAQDTHVQHNIHLRHMNNDKSLGHHNHDDQLHYKKIINPSYYKPYFHLSQKKQDHHIHEKKKLINPSWYKPYFHQATSQHHHQAHCTSFMVYFSLFKEELFYQGTFLRIVEFLIHFVALIGIRNMILKQEQYFDERTTSMSDYSIIVSNLPQTMGNRLRLQKLFQNEFGMTFCSGNSQIKEMIYVFKDHQLQQLEHKGKQIQVEILESINSKDIHKVQQLEKQLQATKRQQQTLVRALHQRIAKDQIKCIKMIVVFNTESDKASVIQSYKATIQNGHDYNHYFSDTQLKHQQKTHIVFKQAPQPNEIIWQHIDESDTTRKTLILKGYGLTFIFLAIITVFFYFILLGKTRLFISAIQRQLHNPQDQTAKTFKAFATAIVFVAIFGVVLFNKFIMGQVLHKIVHSQRHAYTDRQNHSFSIKYALGMFFTTALMTLAVQAITFRNFYSHEYGVIEEETIMFFVTAFLIPLVWLIHPFNLARKFKLWRNKNTLVSQEKANLLSQDVAYDLGKRYAEVFQIMWFTFLYSQLIPLGSFLVLVGLFLYFWVDKLNFLRRSAIKTGISGKMAILALKSLDATLFLAPAGQLLFDWILRSKFDYLSLVFALIGIAYLFVPISEIIWYFNSEKFFLEKRTYEEVKYSFKETYYTLHPVYRLAFADKIKKYKQKYRQSSIQELKSIKIYGTGRGTYKQIRYTPDEKTSRITTFPSIEDIHKSRFLGTLLK